MPSTYLSICFPLSHIETEATAIKKVGTKYIYTHTEIEGKNFHQLQMKEKEEEEEWKEKL